VLEFESLKKSLRVGKTHFLTQTDHTCIDGEMVMDDVLRFEHYQEEVTRLCERLDVEMPDDLPVLNKTNHKAYREHYTDETWAKASALFSDDIERFYA